MSHVTSNAYDPQASDQTPAKYLVEQRYKPERACGVGREVLRLSKFKIAESPLQEAGKEADRIASCHVSAMQEMAFEVVLSIPVGSSAMPIYVNGKTPETDGKPKASNPTLRKPQQDKSKSKAEADAMLDEALRETFPASDALSITRDRPIDDREG